MAFKSTWDETTTEPPAPSPEEVQLIEEAQQRYKDCEDWEANARVLFEYDYKFANGDAHNLYQWDQAVIDDRVGRPTLTINKTKVHNLMVINDAKQNKPGVRIRPVGDEASFEGAQIFQEIVYHVEYISNAENVYDSASTWQVEAGIGYWRVNTDYINNKSFDQEIYIRRIKDPRAVYLDPNINEVDGSDATFGFIFEDMPKKLFAEKYPDFASIASSSTLSNTNLDNWITKDNIRIAEYYKKTQKEDKLVTWTNPDTRVQVLKCKSEFDDQEKLMYEALKKEKTAHEMFQFNERKIITDNIHWYKIAGNRVIDDGPWLGKYIPIVRLVGTETVIDGILDRKGHTRALINAQQMYNYNSSANIEFGALQTKSPWLAPTEAIGGFENYWETANTKNHSYLPYNHMGEDGKPIPPPSRPAAPQASPSYVEGMKISQNEMMMATGQYQSQLGENENAKSGVAINARQRQGDKATYHFIDNQAIAIRYTGKILIDLIPKIYDTKRIMQIRATNGSILNVTIDPKAEQDYQEINDPNKRPQMVDGQKVQEVIFNPNFGYYDIQADTGPSFATKRMEAANALTQIASADKDFLKIGGDVFFSMLDFPKADVLAQRYRKMIPPNITGEAPDPATEEMMHKASDHIEMLNGQVQKLQQDLDDKNKELLLKAGQLDLNTNKEKSVADREDYKAETERLTAVGNAGPAVSIEQLQPVLRQLLAGMAQNGELVYNAPGPHEGGTPNQLPQEGENSTGKAPGKTDGASEGDGEPPMEGARKAGDGLWYVKQGNGYARVEAGA